MRIPRYQDELSSYGQHFSSRGNIAGATFIYVLYKQVPAHPFLYLGKFVCDAQLSSQGMLLPDDGYARQEAKAADPLTMLHCRMTEHILPKEMVGLEGVYLEAFSKMHGLLEDSGWQLAKEPEEGQQLELQEEPTEEQLQATSYLN